MSVAVAVPASSSSRTGPTATVGRSSPRPATAVACSVTACGAVAVVNGMPARSNVARLTASAFNASPGPGRCRCTRPARTPRPRPPSHRPRHGPDPSAASPVAEAVEETAEQPAVPRQRRSRRRRDGRCAGDRSRVVGADDRVDDLRLVEVLGPLDVGTNPTRTPSRMTCASRPAVPSVSQIACRPPGSATWMPNCETPPARASPASRVPAGRRPPAALASPP